jgi:hypothetical protein
MAARNGGGAAPPAGEVTEVNLLLTVRQAAVLETMAWQRGVTVGQLVRCIIRAFLSRSDEPKD